MDQGFFLLLSNCKPIVNTLAEVIETSDQQTNEPQIIHAIACLPLKSYQKLIYQHKDVLIIL